MKHLLLVAIPPMLGEALVDIRGELGSFVGQGLALGIDQGFPKTSPFNRGMLGEALGEGGAFSWVAIPPMLGEALVDMWGIPWSSIGQGFPSGVHQGFPKTSPFNRGRLGEALGEGSTFS